MNQKERKTENSHGVVCKEKRMRKDQLCYMCEHIQGGKKVFNSL